MEQERFSPPEGYIFDESTGRYYSEKTGKNKVGENVRKVRWFDPADGTTVRCDYVVEPTKETRKLYGYPKANARRSAWIGVICGLLAVVLLGGATLAANKGLFVGNKSEAYYNDINTALFYGGLIARQDGYVLFSDIENGGVLCAVNENDSQAQSRVLTDIPAVNLCVVNDTLYFTGVSGSFYLRDTDSGSSMEQLPLSARNVTGLLEFQCLDDRIVWGGNLYCIENISAYLKGGSGLAPYEQMHTPGNGYCYSLALENGSLCFTQAQIAAGGDNTPLVHESSEAFSVQPLGVTYGTTLQTQKPNTLFAVTQELRGAVDLQTAAVELGVMRDIGKAAQDYYNELAEASGSEPIHLIEPTRAEIDAETRETRVKEAQSWVKLNEQVPEGYSYGGITYTCSQDGRYSYAYYRSDDYDKKPILISLDHGTGEQTVSYVKGPPKVVNGSMYYIDQKTGALLEYNGSSAAKSVSTLPVDSFAFTDEGNIVVTYTGDEGEPQSALITKKNYLVEYVYNEKDENTATASANIDASWYTHTMPPSSLLPQSIKGNFVDPSDHPYGTGAETYYEIAYAGGDRERGAYYNKVTVSYDSDGNRVLTRTPAWNLTVPPGAMTPEWMQLYRERPSIVANTLRSEALRKAEEEKSRIIPPGYHMEPVDGDWFKGANIVKDAPAVDPQDAAKAAIEIARNNPDAARGLYPQSEQEKILKYYADNIKPENSVIRRLISGSTCMHGDPLIDDVLDAWKASLEYEVVGSRISGDTAAVDIHIIQNVDLYKDYEYFAENSTQIIFDYCDEYNVDIFAADNSWYNDMVAKSSMDAAQNGALAKDLYVTLTMKLNEDNQWVLENPQEAIDRVMASNSFMADNARQVMEQLSPEQDISKWAGSYTDGAGAQSDVQYDAALQRTQIDATVEGSKVKAEFYDFETQDGFFSAYYYAQDAKPGDLPLGHVYGTNANGELHAAYMKLSNDESTMSMTDVGEAVIVSAAQMTH